ncbi:DUF935 domain-containing protein [Segnochrobactrum spirostomi]|uniref:DUF935 domain-containing protein n=1 Tax=Segnochrobactrum spirostomi TaxID=2608987 RepID=A0A6A7Y8U2_9HYPH|nr:DUF935 domain-containing protein [Segnochrobactrum spirostomi]MQT14398.1 DUF935 domain-containing protein [Segnochrobactrum spirostomi]
MARLSTILGPDGRPVDKDLLTGPPIAGPTLAGVRSPISGHPADGMTPSRMAAIHRAAAGGDTLRYYELAEDIEERDLHYTAVLGTRRRQVGQLPIMVEAASDDADHVRHADFVREWVSEDTLGLGLFDVLDAIGKGISITEITWEWSGDGYRPATLDWRSPTWFEPDTLTLDRPLLRGVGGGEELAEHRFMIHRHKAKSGLTARSGIARIASWAWMYKAFTARDWAAFVQNYGQPVRVGRYDASASKEDREVLWRAVANIAGDCAAIIPRSMEIEFIETKSASDGSALYEKRADWLDRQVSKLVLGQVATTDAAPGSHAIGSTHRAVQEDLERYDARLLSATVTQQIVHRMVAFTFGPQSKYPRLRIGRPDDVPIAAIVDAVSKLGPLGLRVEASQIRDRLGLTEPAAGADVEIVGGRQATPPAAPAPVDPSPALQTRRPGALVAHLVELHAASPDTVARLTDQLAQDAAGALAGLTEEVRSAIEDATSLDDAGRRLAALQLAPDDLARALAQAMALADMIGRAAVLDELRAGA